MRHRFDNAAVESESRLDEFFAVACRAGVNDFQFSTSQCCLLLQGVQSIRYSLNRISQIQAVIGEDNISRRRLRIHPYRNNLRRSRARVNTNHNLLFSFIQRFGFGSEFSLRFEPFLVLFLILEQRQQTAGPFRLYFFFHPTSEYRN